jgi:hypothetical protein
MIWTLKVADFGAWHDAFKADQESRDAAGLGTLQVWRGADAPDEVWVLFRVSDKAKASAFLDSGELSVHRKQGDVSSLTATLLETV